MYLQELFLSVPKWCGVEVTVPSSGKMRNSRIERDSSKWGLGRLLLQTLLLQRYVGGIGLSGLFRALAQAVEPALQEFST